MLREVERLLIRNDLCRRIAPEPLDVVICAHTRLKHVHHDVNEIQQNPLKIGQALFPPNPRILFPCAIDHRIGDGLDLRVALTGAHDKIICDIRKSGKIQNFDIDCLLGQRQVGSESCELM
jgi:hypothetical protein